MLSNKLNLNYLQLKLNYQANNAIKNFYKIEHNDDDLKQFEILMKDLKQIYKEPTNLMRLKLFLTYLLINLTKYLNSPDDKQAIYECVLLVYSDKADRCVPMDLLSSLKTRILKKINYLIKTSQISQYEEKLIDLLEQNEFGWSPLSGIDDSQTVYSDELFHKELTELFREQNVEALFPSIFYEISKSVKISGKDNDPNCNSIDETELNLIKYFSNFMQYSNMSNIMTKTKSRISITKLNESNSIDLEKKETSFKEYEFSSKNCSKVNQTDVVENKKKSITKFMQDAFTARYKSSNNHSEISNSDIDSEKETSDFNNHEEEKDKNKKRKYCSKVDSNINLNKNNKMSTKQIINKKNLLDESSCSEKSADDGSELDFDDKNTSIFKRKSTNTSNKKLKTNDDSTNEEKKINSSRTLNEDKSPFKKTIRGASLYNRENSNNKTIHHDNNKTNNNKTIEPPVSSDDESYTEKLINQESKKKDKTLQNSKVNRSASISGKKIWDDDETLKLVLGVEIYGKGNWSKIKSEWKTEFKDRTSVNLKDKYRNLEKNEKNLSILIKKAQILAKNMKDQK